MAKLFFLVFLFSINNITASSANHPKVDTLYVLSSIKDLEAKFQRNSAENYQIDFFFNIKWQKKNGTFSSIVFNYNAPSSPNLFWKTPMLELKNVVDKVKILSLIEFTGKLQNADFVLSLTSGKIQLVLLYGEECSSKFEAYPVKVGSDLSSEG